MPSLPPSSPTGRFSHNKPEIQRIPIPEGVSETQDFLAKMVRLHEKAMQGALGIPKHLMKMDLTQSNFDYAKLERRLAYKAEVERRMNKTRRKYRRPL